MGELQEEDVIGVLNSTDIAQLLPIGDRILVEVRYYPSVGLRAVWYGCVNVPAEVTMCTYRLQM